MSAEPDRLDAALARAAELVGAGSERDTECCCSYEADYLAGWAKAVKLLSCWHQETYEESDGSSVMDYIMHDGVCGTACDEPCKPCKATASFCAAMLGPES